MTVPSIWSFKLVVPIHRYIRSLDGFIQDNDFSITTSPQNQRIESYCSILQREHIGWWKRFLQDLTDTDLLVTSDPVILDCIRFCFMHLIREDLSTTKDE